MTTSTMLTMMTIVPIPKNMGFLSDAHRPRGTELDVPGWPGPGRTGPARQPYRRSVTAGLPGRLHVLVDLDTRLALDARLLHRFAQLGAGEELFGVGRGGEAVGNQQVVGGGL